jgi:predicted ribosome quality control (RQC) complex YloA/Tae2 family protein
MLAAMDILTLDAIVRELKPLLTGAAVGKIHQPGADDLVLRLWNGRENLRLLISASARAARLHLTAETPPNPQAPPRFCQLLRSRLRRLLAIDRVPGERIVRLVFSGAGESRWTLIAELLGPQANLLLLDAEGRIVDSLKRQTETRRPALPGTLYDPPPARERVDLFGEIPNSPADRSLVDWLKQAITPMTELLAADLDAAVACGGDPRTVLEEFRVLWLAENFSPAIVDWQGRSWLTPLVPAYLELQSVRPFATVSEAAEAYYRDGAREVVFGGGRDELGRLLGKARARLHRRLEQIEAETARMGDYQRQRQWGELLLGNLARLRRGMTEITVDDWYAEPPTQVSIPLDPALTPKENAELCFKRRRKGKRGLEHAERRRLETLEELDWLEGVALALEEAETPAEFDPLREELVAAGLLKGARPAAKRPVSSGAEAGIRQTLSPSGLTVFWGLNNRANDRVSKTLTDPDDLWFHAHRLPGCHLVLKRAGRREIPEEDIAFAASLAAGYSRGRHDLKVEVMLTPGKKVRKPKGARPGLVLAEPERTLMVAPRRLERDAGKRSG